MFEAVVKHCLDTDTEACDLTCKEDLVDSLECAMANLNPAVAPGVAPGCTKADKSLEDCLGGEALQVCVACIDNGKDAWSNADADQEQMMYSVIKECIHMEVCDPDCAQELVTAIRCAMTNPAPPASIA